jgi:alpha-D-ribose 1-methylphosphonate 5-triphosphate diphosphatase
MHQEFAVKNRRALVAIAHDAGAALASHDDATSEHVGEAIADRVSIAEFPTTLEAAEQSHDGGVRVLMGAPNIVRGGSHSGNVAAQDLAEAGRGGSIFSPRTMCRRASYWRLSLCRALRRRSTSPMRCAS